MFSIYIYAYFYIQIYIYTCVFACLYIYICMCVCVSMYCICTVYGLFAQLILTNKDWECIIASKHLYFLRLTRQDP